MIELIINQPAPNLTGLLLPIFLLGLIKKQLKLIIYIINIINHNLWIHRNDVHKQNKPVSTQQVINRSKYHLKATTLLHFSHYISNDQTNGLQNFKDDFCIRGAFCSVSNNNVIFS